MHSDIIFSSLLPCDLDMVMERVAWVFIEL